MMTCWIYFAKMAQVEMTGSFVRNSDIRPRILLHHAMDGRFG